MFFFPMRGRISCKFLPMHFQIINAIDSIDQTVTVEGWVANKRTSGKIAFLELRDGSGFVQAVTSNSDVSPEAWAAIESLTLESSVKVTGKIVRHPKQEGVFELQVSEVHVVQIAEEYPISKKEHGPEFLLDNRHLWIRSRKQWAVLRLRHMVKAGFQEYFNTNGFVEIDTPMFTPTSCEGTTELFEVDYFGQPAFLSQNGQLYLEALAMSFGKVYDLCPNFRAEKSKTRKHLTEFWALNPEMTYVTHDESLQIQEAAIKHMVAYVLEWGHRELAILERDIEPLRTIAKYPFTQYEYPDAIAELQKRGSNITYGDDIGAEDEVLLTQDSDVPVIVKNWPKAIKPFYMKTHPEDPERVLNADILAPRGFGEVVGGSAREDDYETLKAAMEKDNLNMDDFGWYLDLRKYGSVPHAGFGIGIERMVRWVSGIHHVRETSAFPRMLNRLRP